MSTLRLAHALYSRVAAIRATHQTSTSSNATVSAIYLAQRRLFRTSLPRKLPGPPRYPRSGPGSYNRGPGPQDAEPLLSGEKLWAWAKNPSYQSVAVIAVGGGAVFYFTHLETVAVSGRTRFNCVSAARAEKDGERAYQQIIEQEGQQGKILPDWDKRVHQVKRVLARLIEGGKLGNGSSGGGSGWEVTVIEDPDTKNAFVLPGGKVFVYSGILPICKDDNGLSAVLGHEIAHNIAQHAAERMSSVFYLQPIFWGLVYIDFVVFGGLGVSRALGNVILDLGVMRPASRQQENEADLIGLMLMAQSCYDPRAAVGLWERMDKAQRDAPPEWLSTHPSNENRAQRLTALLPKAEEERSKSDCGATSGYVGDFQKVVEGFW